MKSTTSLLSCAAMAVMLTACGGSSTPAVVVPDPVPPPDPVPVVYADAAPGSSLDLWNRCEVMHPGGVQNQPGTQADEKGFIRAITQETYLWNSEVPAIKATDYPTVVAYFNALKTPKLLANGRPKDRFHYSYPREVWEALSSGVELSYGISWNAGANQVPRQWRIAMVDAGSPAERAGLRRGDQLIMIDNEDFIYRGDSDAVARFNAALAPTKADQPHRFTWWRDGRAFDTALTVGSVNALSVQAVQLLDTPSGKTGYLNFTSHNAPAERQLYEAMMGFSNAGVKELVLDMRYNGGGQISIASQLAYMIAGPAASSGKVFMRYATNGRLNPGRPTSFLDFGIGFASTQPLPFGTKLPHLDLKRVTLLTGPGTCSASEALINGLRGIDIEVRLVGGQTCGKPYAFVPMTNCGTTYFMVQYQGTNNKGWGDFDEGFAPDCRVDDDMGHALGDPAESLLATALRLNAGASCAAVAARQGGRSAAAPLAAGSTPDRTSGDSDAATVQVRSPLKEISILPERR
ncbi:peptidase S41 [Pseudoduganella sp. FT93W]|uniref:Peptidase S41 n=1 Tax=Duganella fentianensis TaxID=2692177 RepID=A0A845I3L9_9BURK|nr:S41 family peptidase [Duganella fentianensis]MYN46461.1 peptidase S41 [Duganella fentianensis]